MAGPITIYPTNASYMATMAVAKVNWVDWLKIPVSTAFVSGLL